MRNRDEMKRMIYKLDAASSETLVDQLVGNLSRGIRNGVYRPGDKLPGMREMSELADVSMKVVFSAVKKLEDKGLVKGRRRVGITVLEKSRKVWRGNVLFIYNVECPNYYQNVVFAKVSSVLATAGWRVGCAFFRRKEKGASDLALLKSGVRERPDLVIGLFCNDEVANLLSKSDVPFLTLSDADRFSEFGCIGRVVHYPQSAILEFADYCRTKGVSRVLQVRARGGDVDVSAEMRKRHIQTEDIEVVPENSELRLESYGRFAFDAVFSRFGNGRLKRPDVVFFADDFLALGGMWALEKRGLQAPRDIGLVTWSQRGFRPQYLDEVTRIEEDAFDNSERLARVILSFLRTGKFPAAQFFTARFVCGATF